MMGAHACRDFTDADYEALLQLDSDLSRPRLTDAELSTLRTHVHGSAKAKGCAAAAPCAPEHSSGLLEKVRTGGLLA
jgi:hypothetical protein